MTISLQPERRHIKSLNPDLADHARQFHEIPYRADIDGLRAVAVSLVILYHGFPRTVTGGFVGVDVFFVISGFLISSNIFRTLEAGTFSFRDFYARRVRRIFPALAVVLAVVLGYGFVVLLPSELALLGRNVAGGAGFVSNLVLWHEAGYFDQAAIYKPLLHLWSLGVEEQFYIVWPLALWLLHRFGLARMPFLIGIGIASFAFSLFVVAHGRTADFYSPLTRLWELDAGAVLAMLVPAGNGRSSMGRNIVSLAGLGLILAAALGFDRAMAFPGWRAALPVAGAMLLIASGPAAIVNRRMLMARAAVFVGMISYPLYLWHWPLISYAYVIDHGLRLKDGLVAALILVSVAAAWLTYRYVERPLRFGVARRRNVILLVATMAAIGGAGLAVWQARGFPGRYPPMPKVSIARINAAIRNGIFKPTPAMTVRHVQGITVARIGHGKGKAVLFSGDSVLFQYGPRVQYLLDQGTLAHTVYFVAGPSCPPVPGVHKGGLFAYCDNMSAVFDHTLATHQIGAIVLGAYWSGYLSGNATVQYNGHWMKLDRKSGAKLFFADLQKEVTRLEAAGHPVYLVLDPIAGSRFDPAKMVRRTPFGVAVSQTVQRGVQIARMERQQASVNSRIRAIALATGATVLNPLHDVCGTGARCPVLYGDGKPKFADGLHLRPGFVRRHITMFDPILTK
jgi:peptidoglycan/LPS O-acetylase OafA/YrhL